MPLLLVLLLLSIHRLFLSNVHQHFPDIFLVLFALYFKTWLFWVIQCFASQIPPIRGIEWKYAEKWKYGNFLLTTDGSKLFGKILIKLIIMRFLCRFWSIPFGILITLCWELLWCSMFKLCKWVFLGIFGDFNWFRARVGWPAETAQSTRWHCVHSLLNWPAFAVWMRSRLETEIFCCCRTIYWNHMFRIYLLSKCKHHISYN